MNDATIDDSHVSGRPTKQFFISMLTRDITVNDSIGDLVDNAVDAARKQIYKNSEKGKVDLFDLQYENVEISIQYDESSFTIKDNAGGIPFEIAKHYAFCFGRPEEFTGTPGSIGQFGIGMKRAFFKMGRKIVVESSMENSYFKVEIDVDKWKRQESWDFDVTEKLSEMNKGIGYGTKITIEDLYGETKDLFKDSTFFQKLREEIGIENWFNILKGVNISINGHALKAQDLILKSDDTAGLRPGQWQHDFKEINVRIICGVGDLDKKSDGGWYIFCNDRLILAHDQTPLTGWTGEGKKVGGGPVYHGQYQAFRGFVFFESESPANFPWNTAKTSINPEHPLYVVVKAKMIDMMRDVNTFLNAVKTESDGEGRGNKQLSPTQVTIANAKSVSIKDLAQKKIPTVKFSAPDTVKNKKVKPNVQVIKYEVEMERFEVLCNLLDTNDAEKVGLETFNYYYKNEA